jgi:hypothetical protein
MHDDAEFTQELNSGLDVRRDKECSREANLEAFA